MRDTSNSDIESNVLETERYIKNMLGKDDKKANALIEKEKGDIKENKDKNSNACRKITFSNVTNKKSNRNKEDKDNKILEKIESKLSNQTSERNEKINENEEELET